MGCFVRLRREDGAPDRVGIGLREDLVNDRSLLREYHRTLLHELGHWATTHWRPVASRRFPGDRATTFQWDLPEQQARD